LVNKGESTPRSEFRNGKNNRKRSFCKRAGGDSKKFNSFDNNRKKTFDGNSYGNKRKKVS
ncbi:MAG: ATP-dependent helicase, partial [Rickettsia endosymbiont of Ixodes persulcatus]|nr:ATP-dependent helicase [Rickettsia endosymbiont of Ixodes persulcatus]